MKNIPHSNKNFRLTVIIFLFVFFIQKNSSAVIPRPDHVVICVLENHGYSQIIGSTAAPFINSLLPQAANLQEFYALTHPSQPNYIMMYSGSNQGETTDNLPSGTPWTTPNLGSSLLYTGYTFAGYSEGLPSQGSTVGSSGAYARKHCPWVNWQGNGPNQIPASCNLSMDDFPTNYAHLPDLSFVIPDQNNDMHNGSDPGKITTGDSWIEYNLKSYIDWAQNNNSLFVLVFDEDNFTSVNRIVCLFVGPMVRPGEYFLTGYNHYDLLRTFEDMFGLPHAGNSAFAIPIEEIWKTSTTTVSEDHTFAEMTVSVYPNPVNENSQLMITSQFENDKNDIKLFIYDISGRLVSEEIIEIIPGTRSYTFHKEELSVGLYTYQLKNEKHIFDSGKLLIEN